MPRDWGGGRERREGREKRKKTEKGTRDTILICVRTHMATASHTHACGPCQGSLAAEFSGDLARVSGVKKGAATSGRSRVPPMRARSCGIS
eukprot:5789912-Pyramimonas_sp.AAC.1